MLMSKKTETKAGQIRIELLFKGSKSEALYPVLHCEDGNNYRLHIKGNEGSDTTLLEPWVNKDVILVGDIDDIRGHWRMLLDSDLKEAISLISSDDCDEVGKDDVVGEIKDFDVPNSKDAL